MTTETSVVSLRRDAIVLAAGAGGLFLATGIFVRVLHVDHPLIVGFTFLLIVLLAASTARFWVAAIISLAATAAFNFFFLAPVGTLYLSDPENWVALLAFLTVSLVASNLSTAARARAARHSEELKSVLLASLAHDLRTPLTAIRVAAGNLQEAWLSDDDRREQGDLIVAEVDRLQRLFQNVLDIARIEAGAVSPERGWVHTTEIVEAARDQVHAALRGRRLDVDCGADPAVLLDPRLTATALAHVLENAAKYSNHSGRIAVDACAADGTLRIKVRDEGPGIPAADLPHLFERFYRGSASAPVPGTGMGLAIARGLLAAERGRIWVENSRGGGASFTIEVPARHRVTPHPELTV